MGSFGGTFFLRVGFFGGSGVGIFWGGVQKKMTPWIKSDEISTFFGMTVQINLTPWIEKKTI